MRQGPVDDFERIDRKLDLQQLLPDLLLLAAQANEIVGVNEGRPREKGRAKPQQLVHRLGDIGPVAEHVS